MALHQPSPETPIGRPCGVDLVFARLFAVALLAATAPSALAFVFWYSLRLWRVIAESSLGVDGYVGVLMRAAIEPIKNGDARWLRAGMDFGIGLLAFWLVRDCSPKGESRAAAWLGGIRA